MSESTPRDAALELSISSRPAAVPAVRRSADGLASALAEDASGRLRLLISEIVSNAVLHGSTDEAAPLTARVFISEDKIRVEVSDAGGGLTEPASADRYGDREGGFGLKLVEALADRWGSEEHNGQHTLWFELDVAD